MSNENPREEHQKVLYNYIHQKMLEGFSKGQIKEALLSRNWPLELIEEIFNEIERVDEMVQVEHIPIGDHEKLVGALEEMFSISWEEVMFEDQIKKSLIRKGWSEADVETAFEAIHRAHG